MKIIRKNGLVKALCTLALSCAISPMVHADWSVQGSQILDPNGKPFVYRGVNLGIVPPLATLPRVYADIAATGANAVRIPIDNLTAAQAEVHVNLCKQHNLVCVFTYVLSAGYTDSFRAPSSLHVLDVWPQFVDLLKANTDYVAVDIASAMAGNTAGLDYYISYYQTVIQFMRADWAWGLKNQLIISGGNWGQDWSFLMRDNAQALLALDPLKNTVLSVHMYEAYKDPQTIRSYLESFTNRNLPVMIAEFGPIKRDRYDERANPFTTTDVNVDAIMDISKELGIGYLGWNWSGYMAPQSNLPDYSALNIVTDFNSRLVTPWGNQLINNSNGIKATAKPATNFPVSSSSSSSSSAGSQPEIFEIIYKPVPANCGAVTGKLIADVWRADGWSGSYSWEIYQSNTMTTTYVYGNQYSIDVNWPAQASTTITLTVADQKGNFATKVKELGVNPNLECASSSSSVNSSSSSSARSSSSSLLSSSAKSSSSSLSSSSAKSSSSSSVTSSSRSSSSRPISSSSSSSKSSSSARSSSSVAAQGNCRYVINSQWDNGFSALIRVKNTGTQPINGWDVRWQYTNNSSVTDSWNVKLEGQNPYSAKNLSWNATINPGQTVEFGFNGKKPAGPAQIPVVTGSVCQ